MISHRWIWGSHGSDYEGYGLLCSNAVEFGDSPTFRRTMSVYRLLLLVSCLAYFPTLKVETICSTEWSGSIRTPGRHNPQDRTSCDFTLFIYFKQLVQRAHNKPTAGSNSNGAVSTPIHTSEANETLRHLLTVSETHFNYLWPETHISERWYAWSKRWPRHPFSKGWNSHENGVGSFQPKIIALDGVWISVKRVGEWDNFKTSSSQTCFVSYGAWRCS
jgi:hypothetical protein